MNVVAFVCARAGSKGLRSKNIMSIAGKPLIQWSLEQALACESVNEVCVSSDSNEIINLAKKIGVSHVIRRPDHLAGDRVGKWEVWQHAIADYEKSSSSTCDMFVDLDCTSPLRDTIDISNCIERLKKSKADGVFSICEARKNPYFNLVERNSRGGFTVSKELPSPILSRQAAPPVFEHVASIYCLKREYLMTSTGLLDGKMLGYDIGQRKSLDIDTMFDFELVEFLLKKLVSE